MDVKRIIDEVISLPVEERAAIIDSLLRSLNTPCEEVDRAWKQVAERRLQELRSGNTKAIPGEDVFEGIWKRYG